MKNMMAGCIGTDDDEEDERGNERECDDKRDLLVVMLTSLCLWRVAVDIREVDRVFIDSFFEFGS